MSWLNLNQSLSNIKGQITNFASEVLSEGTVDENDPSAQLAAANDKIKQLETACTARDLEIKTLRRQNAEYHHERLNTTVSKTHADQSGAGQDADSSWFWDPPDETKENAQSPTKDVQDLERQLAEAKRENEALAKSLVELDAENQMAMEKMISLKNDLQLNYEQLIREHDRLRDEYESAKDNDDEKATNAHLKERLEGMHKKFDNLEKVHRLLIENTEKFQEENLFMTEENSKLSRDLEDALARCSDMEKSLEDANDNLKRSQEENHELVEENFRLQEDCTNLQHSLDEQTKKTDRKNHVTIEEYKTLEEKFSKLESQYSKKNKSSDILDIVEQSTLQDSQTIIERLKCEIAELQNKLNTNEEIKRLNVENVNLKTEVESLKNERNDNFIPCNEIKNFFDRYDILEIDKKIKNSALKDDVLQYVDRCLECMAQCKRRNETLEIRVLEDSKEICKLKTKIDEINSEMYILNADLSQCEHECSEMKKNNDFLISEISALKSSSKLEPILEQNEDNVVMLQNELDDCSNRKQTIEAELLDQQNEIIVMKEERAKLEKELEIVKNELANREDCQQVLSKTQSDNEKLKKQVSTLNVDLEKLKIDISVAENDKVLILNEISVLKNDLESKSIICERTKTVEIEKENLETKFVSLTSDLDETRRSQEALKIKLNELNDLLNTSHSKVENMKSIISKKDIEVRNTTDRLDETNNLYSKSCEALKERDFEIERLNVLVENQNSVLTSFNSECMDLLMKTIKIHNISISKNEKEELDVKNVLETVLDFIEKKIILLNNNVSEKCNDILKLKEENNKLATLNSDLINHQNENNSQDLITKIEEIQVRNNQLEDTVKTLENYKSNIEIQLNEYAKGVKEDQVKIAEFGLLKVNMENQLQQLNSEKNELIELVKQKHTENVNYHNEIQRLNEILINESEKYKKLEEINLILCQEQTNNVKDCSNCVELTEHLKKSVADCNELTRALNELSSLNITKDNLEKLSEKNQFLAEKCDVLAHSLLQEQNNTKQIISEKTQIAEREQSLLKEVERLRQHLFDIGEAHTQELLVAEQKCQEMQSSLAMAEEKVKHSSTLYTSNSIRANQEVETLRNQLKLIEKQRDDIQAHLNQSEDQNNKNIAALTNLQCVLEQFQLDQNQDNEITASRIKRELEQCQQENQRLLSEIGILQNKLIESNNGLKAAARLSSQLDTRAAQLNEMKVAVAEAEEELSQWKQKYKNVVSNQQDKVDKILMKNLVIGLIQTSMNQKRDDKKQALRVLSTVLDFDQKECEKVGLIPSSSHHESLMEEFVKFIEKETRPPLNTVLPNLLNLGQSNGGHEIRTASRKNSEIVPPMVTQNESGAGNISPLTLVNNNTRNSPNSRMSPNRNNPSSTTPVPIVINPINATEVNTSSGNAILDAASSNSDVVTGVNQTRNTQGAILKNVLLDM